MTNRKVEVFTAGCARAMHKSFSLGLLAAWAAWLAGCAATPPAPPPAQPREQVPLGAAVETLGAT